MVECTGLENRHRETYRGFESHPLRHFAPTIVGHKVAVDRGWTTSVRRKPPGRSGGNETPRHRGRILENCLGRDPEVAEPLEHPAPGGLEGHVP